jgi:hypothetical protein
MKAYSEILDGYSPLLFEHRVPASLHADFRKWVRFYLDFCEKYGHPPRSSDSLAPSVAKLGQKNQGEDRISQAGQAVSLLCNLVKRDPESKQNGGAPPVPASSPGQTSPRHRFDPSSGRIGPQ